MELKEVFEPVLSFVKNFQKKEKEPASKQAAKDRLKLVLMQDRASVSPDFFDMMKKELIDVIKKYIEIDEESLEVELTRGMEVGLEGPALYANIPIKNVKPVAPQGEEIDEITEEQIDDAAEEILNHLEEVAKQNKEELAEQFETSNELEEAKKLEEEVRESFEEEFKSTPETEVLERTTETFEEPVEGGLLKEESITAETEEIEEMQEPQEEKIEMVEEKKTSTTKRKTTSRKTTTKKKEKGTV